MIFKNELFNNVKNVFFAFLLILFFNSNSYSQNFKILKIADLNTPWSMSFISKNELIITEKSGKLKILNLNQNKIKEINHNLNFREHGQGGLLDILYNDDNLYISYSENRGNGTTSTSVAKAKLEAIK